MNVLIIDDDTGICATLSAVIKRSGHSPTCAHTVQTGMTAVISGTFDIVLLDVQLPDGNGIDVLPAIKSSPSQPEVIIMTGKGDPDGAELAITNGAWDYIEKPSSLKEMTLPFQRAAQYRREKRSPVQLVALKRGNIVGSGPAISACIDRLAETGNSDASVLISGETGTGKELFARAVHENSRRSNNSYITVDCAALPENLVEGALFGHARGAYTGADRAADGLLKKADGGTVLLDEVGELPLQAQSSFLRVLQEKRFRPVGSDREVVSDFRLVSATNRDLDQMVKAGQFRQDLLFRLRAIAINLPPVRDRIEDIKDLAMHAMGIICERTATATKGFSPEFLEAILAYPWPGNVRELMQSMEHVLATAQFEPTLFPTHLPNHIRVQLVRGRLDVKAAKADATRLPDYDPNSQIPTLKALRERALARIEKSYLETLASKCHGDAKKMCDIAGIGKSRLYELLQKHGMKRPSR